MIDLVMLKDFLVLKSCRRKSVWLSIQTLEHWLGAPVFEHGTPRTDRGRPPVARRGAGRVRALDNLRQSIRERDEDAQRRIRFCAPHILSVFFPHWIPRLQADFRNAKFSVDCDYLPQCLSRLRDGSVNYVVALLDEGEAVSRRLGIDSEAEFQRLELGHEQLVAVCAPDAAGQPLFNLDRLQTEALSFLGYSRNATWLGPGTAAARQRPVPPAPSQLQPDRGAALLRQSRLGVAWLPPPWSARTSPAVALVRAASTCRCATP